MSQWQSSVRHYLRTKLEAPPPVLLKPLTWAVLRELFSQLSLALRPDFEDFGGSAVLAFFREGPSSSTRMVISSILTSLGRFSTLSRNFSLLGFFCTGATSSTGGVGGLVEGAALRISSGRRAGRPDRRPSWVVEPCRVAVLSDSSSAPSASFFLFANCAWSLRCSSNCFLFSFFKCSSL